MYHAGSVYVAAPPSIWKLTDADGDGIAEKREEWFQGKTLGHCANDLHGPYLGPDGWIYWTKGAWAKQDYAVNGKPWTTKASHIFRCKPDGTGFEPVMTGGMDNPVGIAFTATGDRILTNTFFQQPAGGKRDGLIHAIYGGVSAKDHAPIYDHPWTGPTLMPCRAPPRGRPAAFAAMNRPVWQGLPGQLHLLLQHAQARRAQPDGATYKSKDEDFLLSDNLDFHLIDVVRMPTAACSWWTRAVGTRSLPNVAVAEADVLGAIYRERVEAPVEDPRQED